MSQSTPSEASAQRGTVPDSITGSLAKLVYLFVNVVKKTTVTEISTALKEPKLAVLPVLRTLIENRHLKREGDDVLVC
jgi:hypothetical protein